jgi:hypothetical protein
MLRKHLSLFLSRGSENRLLLPHVCGVLNRVAWVSLGEGISTPIL